MAYQDQLCQNTDRMLDKYRSTLEDAFLVRQELAERERHIRLQSLLNDYEGKLDPMFCARLKTIL